MHPLARQKFDVYYICIALQWFKCNMELLSVSINWTNRDVSMHLRDSRLWQIKIIFQEVPGYNAFAGTVCLCDRTCANDSAVTVHIVYKDQCFYSFLVPTMFGAQFVFHLYFCQSFFTHPAARFVCASWPAFDLKISLPPLCLRFMIRDCARYKFSSSSSYYY